MMTLVPPLFLPQIHQEVAPELPKAPNQGLKGQCQYLVQDAGQHCQLQSHAQVDAD